MVVSVTKCWLFSQVKTDGAPPISPYCYALNLHPLSVKLGLCELGLNWGGGGVLPYMGYIGMCRCEGYGFQ